MIDLPHDNAPPKPTLLAEYRPPDFVIDTVELSFSLGEDETLVRSHLAVRRNPAAGTPHGKQSPPLRLDGEELELVSIALDGATLPANRYRIEVDGDLTILDPPDAFALDIQVKIKPQLNTALSGLYTSGGNFCTQCEAEGFRRITWFLDRPDVSARYKVRIEADKARYPVLLRARRPRWRPPFRGVGRPTSQAQLPVRAGRRRSRRAQGRIHHPLRQDRAIGDLGAARRRG
jgi:aminopeptidase N